MQVHPIILSTMTYNEGTLINTATGSEAVPTGNDKDDEISSHFRIGLGRQKKMVVL